MNGFFDYSIPSQTLHTNFTHFDRTLHTTLHKKPKNGSSLHTFGGSLHIKKVKALIINNLTKCVMKNPDFHITFIYKFIENFLYVELKYVFFITHYY